FPPIRAEQPALHQLRLGECVEYHRFWRIEHPRHNDFALSVCRYFQSSETGHRCSPFFGSFLTWAVQLLLPCLCLGLLCRAFISSSKTSRFWSRSSQNFR